MEVTPEFLMAVGLIPTALANFLSIAVLGRQIIKRRRAQ